MSFSLLRKSIDVEQLLPLVLAQVFFGMGFGPGQEKNRLMRTDPGPSLVCC